jgi:hypothetical protein
MLKKVSRSLMRALRRSEVVETRAQVPLIQRLKCCTQNCNKMLNDPTDTGSFILVSDIAYPLKKIQWMKHSLAQGSTQACAADTSHISLIRLFRNNLNP